MPKKRTAENELVGPAASAAMPPRRKSTPRARTKRTAEPSETPAARITGTVADAVETAADTVSTPTYEEVAQLAYSFWEARGCQGGSPDEDWRRAEEQLRKRASAVNA
jgi:Protein of unknown function (DUF2934)